MMEMIESLAIKGLFLFDEVIAVRRGKCEVRVQPFK